jgi:hypothetical protein
MRARAAILVSAVIGALLLAAAPASASITVANQNDAGAGSLRQAIAEAPAGETIVLPAGTYTLTSEPLLIFKKALTISGHGASDTIVRAGGKFGIFEIIESGNTTISGVTIREAEIVEKNAAGAGVLSVGTNLTLRGDVITRNTVNGNGGPGEAGGSPEAAGVLAVNGSLNLEESAVTENTATAAGGSGKAGGNVNGVGILAVCPTRIVKSTITGNHAEVRGGFGAPSVSQAGGSAEGVGLLVVGKSLTIAESTIASNTATAVGGPGAAGGRVTGAGVLTVAPVTLTDSTISRNAADVRGGEGPSAATQIGGRVEGGGLLAVQSEVTPSSFAGGTIGGNFVNASGGPGGEAGTVIGAGVLEVTSEGPTSFSNMTIASNTARLLGSGGKVEGGGVLAVAGGKGSLTFLGTTISNNGAEGTPTMKGEGGGLLAVGKVSFGNSIVSGGIGPTGSENCLVVETTSLGFNLDSRDQCGFHAAGDQVNKDPQLGPLQGNGGPTETMLPAVSSPAVDQGSTFGLLTDQRKVVRPIDFPSISNAAGGNGADIGAVELQPASALTLGKLSKNKKKGTATLRVTLPQPAAGVLVLKGKGLKRQTVAVGTKPTIKLSIVTKGGSAKKLRKKGKLKVSFEVTYTPAGNVPATAKRSVKLVRKHRHKHRSGGTR